MPHTLHIMRGDTETIKITLMKNDVPIPFEEGDTVRLSVKKRIFDDEYVFQAVVQEFTQDGLAIVTIQPEDTKDIDMGVKRYVNYIYDVEFTDKHGVVNTVITPSVFKIWGDVT